MYLPFISSNSVHEFKTNRHSFDTHGEVTIPVVMDLRFRYKVCNDSMSFEIGSLFHYNKNTSRQKRFIPLILLGSSVAVNIWQAISYSSTQDLVTKDDVEAVRQLQVRAMDSTMKAFTFIERRIESLYTHIDKSICQAQKQILQLLASEKSARGFDAIVRSLKDEALTTDILPLRDALSLIKSIPEIVSSYYINHPYLLYHFAKVQMNVDEVGPNDYILRGVIILPILTAMDSISMRIIQKKTSSGVRLFGPQYISTRTETDVSACTRTVEFYVCKPFQHRKAVYTEITEPISLFEGVLVINVNVTVGIVDRFDTQGTKSGPYISTQNEIKSVIHDKQVLYVTVAQFMVSHDIMDLSPHYSSSTLAMRNGSEFKDIMATMVAETEELRSFKFSDPKVYGPSAFSIITMILIGLAILYYCNRRKRSRGNRGPYTNAIAPMIVTYSKPDGESEHKATILNEKMHDRMNTMRDALVL